jgi:hypothetical protein
MIMGDRRKKNVMHDMGFDVVMKIIDDPAVAPKTCEKKKYK